MNDKAFEEYSKACEKYGADADRPAPDAFPDKRRWQIFLAIETVLVMAFLALFKFGRSSDFVIVTLSVFGTWLAFSLPVALLYLIGKPPVMNLLPLVSSAESRAMTNDVRRRVPMSDEEFYSRFYEGSVISKDTVAKMRFRLRSNIDKLTDRLVPSDYLPLLWDDLDFVDLFYVVGKEFGITLADADWITTFDGTLDNLIRLVHQRIESKT